MKTIILLMLTVVLFYTSAYSQIDKEYLEVVSKVLTMEKKEAVLGIMKFTDAERAPFWELYNEFNNELYIIHNKRVAVILDFANNFDTMTDEKAEELWSSVRAYQNELFKIQKKYYSKFKKILPTAKAVRYFQLEHKIEALINGDMVFGIPLLEER